jgi:hypothetical protein
LTAFDPNHFHLALQSQTRQIPAPPFPGWHFQGGFELVTRPVRLVRHTKEALGCEVLRQGASECPVARFPKRYRVSHFHSIILLTINHTKVLAKVLESLPMAQPQNQNRGKRAGRSMLPFTRSLSMEISTDESRLSLERATVLAL